MIFQIAIVSFTGLCLQPWWVLLMSPFRLLLGALLPTGLFACCELPEHTLHGQLEEKQEWSPLLHTVAVPWYALFSITHRVNMPTPTTIQLPVPVVFDRLASSVGRRDLWEWLGAGKTWLHHFLQCSHRMPFRLWILWEITRKELSWRKSYERRASDTTAGYQKVTGTYQ